MTQAHSPARRRLLRHAVVGAVAGGTLLEAARQATPAHAGTRMQPQPAPPFRLPIHGKTGEFQTLEALAGKVVLLNLWATWCVPCRREFPALEAIAREFGPQGLMVLGVNVEDRDADADIDRFLAGVHPSFAILRDADMTLSRTLAAPGMPATFLVDRAGRLRWQHGGYSPGDEKQYITQVRSLLAEPA